jgi:hypothetical protein
MFASVRRFRFFSLAPDKSAPYFFAFPVLPTRPSLSSRKPDFDVGTKDFLVSLVCSPTTKLVGKLELYLFL